MVVIFESFNDAGEMEFKMIERALVVTDLCKDSCSLVCRLKGLKHFGIKQLLVLVCMNLNEYSCEIFKYSDSAMNEYLERMENSLKEQGFDAEVRLMADAKIMDIYKIAFDEYYDIVVVGAIKRNLSSKIVYSNLAYDVISQAQKPVVLVRLDRNDADELINDEDIGKHILFATDFSENASAAFEYVVGMSDNIAEKITLLHVQDETRIAPYLANRLREFNDTDMERLSDLRDIIRAEGKAKVDLVIKYGSPIEEILGLIDDLGIRLTVLGCQGRGFIKDLFLGSVSNNISRLSSSSVLMIPSEQEHIG